MSEEVQSEQAGAAIKRMERAITSSANFPGGEYFACYLSSLGYSIGEIREFYQQINHMVAHPTATIPPLFQRIGKGRLPLP